jgi:hypothetical protein
MATYIENVFTLNNATYKFLYGNDLFRINMQHKSIDSPLNDT